MCRFQSSGHCAGVRAELLQRALQLAQRAAEDAARGSSCESEQPGTAHHREHGVERGPPRGRHRNPAVCGTPLTPLTEDTEDAIRTDEVKTSQSDSRRTVMKRAITTLTAALIFSGAFGSAAMAQYPPPNAGMTGG